MAPDTVRKGLNGKVASQMKMTGGTWNNVQWLNQVCQGCGQTLDLNMVATKYHIYCLIRLFVCLGVVCFYCWFYLAKLTQAKDLLVRRIEELPPSDWPVGNSVRAISLLSLFYF